MQQQRLIKSREAEQSDAETSADSPRRLNTAPGAEEAARRRKKKNLVGKQLSPLKKSKDARSTQRFNGVEGINLSQAGTWLDSRAFSEASDTANVQPKRLRYQAGRNKRLNEPQRFILKRFKDTLVRRFNSVDAAFRKIDCNQVKVSDPLTINEFVDATAGIFSRAEAQILYRLLDNEDETVVTIEELHTMIDEA